ncbi:FecR family protein [Novosphingobium sp. KN65.2]|uniref:FecR family protein n=1 Tax=Novosphingobium sp. KN65.2 TaxID=1478134 RepID=UPI0005E7719D|nr:FecR domain-containing protein [Novosphingobium sp. KN65.2]CDO35968.1 putative Transcriptional regulator [Novosphingobium sp. KN65.2]
MNMGYWFSRSRRIERQASRWVMLMIDDPHKYSGRVQRWMERSPEHRATYSRIVAGLGRAGNAAAMLPELQEFMVRKATPPARQARSPLALAALAGLAIISVAALYQFKAGDPRPVPIATANIFNAEPGKKTIELADGSHVTLFGATRLAVRLSAHERRIDLLSGRARFEVSHDASRPFVVIAGGGSVTALGTLFEVEVGAKVAVHLLRGRIRVVMPKAVPASTPRDVILTAGQDVSYTSEGSADEAAGHIAPAQAARDEAGTDGPKRTFDDVPVSTIVAAANRQFDVQIELADPSIGQEKIFAELNFLNPESVARKLAEILDLSIDRSRPRRLRLTRTN